MNRYSTKKNVNNLVERLIDQLHTPNPFDPKKLPGTIQSIRNVVAIAYGDKEARRLKITVH